MSANNNTNIFIASKKSQSFSSVCCLSPKSNEKDKTRSQFQYKPLWLSTNQLNVLCFYQVHEWKCMCAIPTILTNTEQISQRFRGRSSFCLFFICRRFIWFKKIHNQSTIVKYRENNTATVEQQSGEKQQTQYSEIWNG